MRLAVRRCSFFCCLVSGIRPCVRLYENILRTLILKIITMSQNRKLRRAKREAEQEQQGKKVVTWIFAALVIFAVIYLVVLMIGQM